jgi:folate-binding protein YgfZ
MEDSSPDARETTRDAGSREGDLPQRYSDLATEWAAVRRRCGVLDARFRGLLRVGGTDRTSFLQGMLTKDVVRLQAGQGTYAALLTIQAKVVSDLRVYALDDEIWLDLPAARTAVVRQALERYIIADDVTFVDEPAEWKPLVSLEGPQAARVLLALTGEGVGELAPLVHRPAVFDGTPMRIVVANHTGERGYLVCGPAAAASTLWAHCQSAGAEPVGMEALDLLRLEAGIPWYGRDVDDSILVAEAGLASAISFDKGCYLGQEVVERVASRGQVQRKLVGLSGPGPRIPEPRATLRHGGRDVGHVTSAGWSLALEAVIALGYVRRDAWELGTPLEIGGDDRALTVVRTPFYAK